tara:strand:+ start:17969 stop:18220 length:252 start_codon:yes stop_codon:yes gene_type:complete
MSYSFTNDANTTERLSQQRDDIYEHVVSQFRVHMANEDIDSAMALADEFFEWMDPEQLEDESTAFYNEEELLRLYMSLPETDD